MSRSALTLLAVLLLVALTPSASAQQPSHKPGGYHSPEIQKDQSWSHVFNATGVSHYHCHPHPFMLGRVEVKDGASTEPVTVEIRGFKFVPDAIVVGVGTNVTWTNRDPSLHTVDESADGPSSEANAAGKSSFVSFLGVLTVVLATVATRRGSRPRT